MAILSLSAAIEGSISRGWDRRDIILPVTLSRRNLLKTSGAGLAMPALGAQTRRGPRNYGWMPRISENLNDVNVSTLKWLKQVGCNHVVLQGTDWVDSDKKGYWSIADIQRVAKPCGEAGLKLESLYARSRQARSTPMRFPGIEDSFSDVQSNSVMCLPGRPQSPTAAQSGKDIRALARASANHG